MTLVEKRFIKKWQKKIPPRGTILAAVYLKCFYAAARRISIVLNAALCTGLCHHTWLQSDDTTIKKRFEAKNLDAMLYHLIFYEVGKVDTSDRWGDYFYVKFDFLEKSGPERIWMQLYIPDTFLDGTYKGLRPPSNFGIAYTLADLHEGTDTDTFQLYRDCATNYLVRNLWHNYVHNEIHRITHENYREVGGQARYEADFEADNWSYLLSAVAYGHDVRTDRIDSWTLDDGLRRMLRRNHCNEVFALRAKFRGERKGVPRTISQLEETEWRYRRSLANYLSGWLICSGRAATSLRIYLTGDVTGRAKRRTYRRDNAGLVVEVNNVRIPVDFDSGALRFEAEEKRAHFKSMANFIEQAYNKRLRQERVRGFARIRLDNLLRLARAKHR